MRKTKILQRGFLGAFIVSLVVGIYPAFAQMVIPSQGSRTEPKYSEEILSQSIIPSSCLDSDEDGYYLNDPDNGCTPTWADCDDNNSDIYRAFDGTCDADTDDHIDISAYKDQKTASDADCDDEDSGVYRGNSEIYYDGKDNDCSASLSAPDRTPDDDIDQDGYGIIYDCNDRSSDQNPKKNEILDNYIDDNCDGLIDENIPQDANDFDVSDPAPWTDIGDTFTKYLPDNINKVLSLSHAPQNSSLSALSRPFDAMSVGGENEVVIHPGSSGEMVIQNNENVGAIFYDTSPPDEQNHALGISAQNLGLSGFATSENGNSSGIVIDTYNEIVPEIGLYSASELVGTYAKSLNDYMAGTKSKGADVGHFASGAEAGIVGEGSYYGLYGKSNSGYGVIGFVQEDGHSIFGALGVDGYGLYTGFDASSKNLNIDKTTSAQSLETDVLSVSSSTTSSRFMGNLNADSISSYLQVQKPLAIGGYLKLWGNLTLSGSLTINNGFLHVDSSISTSNSDVLYFTSSTYIAGNLEALASGKSISASESIGDFYTVKQTSARYAESQCRNQDAFELCSEDGVEVCRSVYDPLVSCSAQSADGSYVGARPKRSTDSICEAYALDENENVTVMAHCFNPLGPLDSHFELPPGFDPTRYIPPLP